MPGRFMERLMRGAAWLIAVCALYGCASPEVLTQEPVIAKISSVRKALLNMPPPSAAVPVAVYGYTDQTGQFKPSDSVQTLSRAVTQGATSILVQALHDAGRGRWFTVLERSHLDNLLKERQIIREMRQIYLGEKGVNPQALPPVLFAGVLLEGGIIGYDTNTMTGGAGARFLGIGGNVEYRQDTVSVYLRAVSTKTGRVLSSVVTRKTIASVGVAANTFKFISFRELLEAEAGITTNEPGLVALEQAIEKAIYSLIVEGAAAGIWAFQDAERGRRIVAAYLTEKGDRAESPEPNPAAAAMPANHSSLGGEDGASHVRPTAAVKAANRIAAVSENSRQFVTAFTGFPPASGVTRTLLDVGHPRSARGNCGPSHRPFARSGGTSVSIRGKSCRFFLSIPIIGQERHETQKASTG